MVPTELASQNSRIFLGLFKDQIIHFQGPFNTITRDHIIHSHSCDLHSIWGRVIKNYNWFSFTRYPVM